MLAFPHDIHICSTYHITCIHCVFISHTMPQCCEDARKPCVKQGHADHALGGAPCTCEILELKNPSPHWQGVLAVWLCLGRGTLSCRPLACWGTLLWDSVCRVSSSICGHSPSLIFLLCTNMLACKIPTAPPLPTVIIIFVKSSEPQCAWCKRYLW